MQCLPKQVADVLPILAGTILTFLHFMYSVFEILQKYLNVFKSMWFQRTTWKHIQCEVDEVAFVISKVKELQKVPKHLVFILGTETLAVKDVVNIVIWSLTAGIPFVSFHDHKGCLKQQKEQLDKALERSGIRRKFTIPAINGVKTTQNGFSNKPVERLSILDASDGKELLVNIVRRLCDQGVEGVDARRPTQEELDKLFVKETGLPEAELAIYMGPVCCMYGFMPWHARITEFLPLVNSDSITVVDFVTLLKKYNKCEQRLGK